MRKAVCAVIIKDGCILLAKKKDVWILPGGKPENNEPDALCLTRECFEELSVTGLSNIIFFDTFTGITPHKNDQLRAKVYFASINQEAIANSEITQIVWTNKPFKYNLSEITVKIINALYQKGYLLP